MPAWAPPIRPEDAVGTGHRWMEPVDTEGDHKGVDVQAVKGTPALSPVDGVVVDIENDPEGLGKQVHIKDKSGHISSLGHLDQIHVKVGDEVKQGQQVADVGSTGNSTGSHLDVRIKSPQGDLQDPTALLGPLAQMPRADQPGPVGAGQEDEAGNPIGWAAAVQDPYADLESRWQHWPGRMPPTLQNPQIPDEQRFWGGPQPQDQWQQFRQMLQQMGPQAAMGWQQMLYGPQGPLAPWGETAADVGGGQDRVHVGTLYRADVGSGQAVGVGQQGGFASPLPSGGIYGAQKWSSPMGSNAVDIFVRRGTPVSAPVSGTIQQGMNGQLILAGDNGWNFAFRHGMTTAQGHVQEGQQIGIVNDPGLDSLGRAPWGNMPDNYQHLEMSVSRGSPNFPATPGGGGNVDAAQFLTQIGYQGQEIPKTPGPPDAQGGGGMGGMGGGMMGGMPGGMGMGGGGMGGGFPGMGGGMGGMFGGMGGGMPGMGMGMGFPGMGGGMGMPGGGMGMGGMGMGGMGMPGMSPSMGMDMGMGGGMGMGQPSGMGMMGDPSMGGGFGGMDPGMGMSTGMGGMDPMAMGAGPQGDFNSMGGGGGGMDLSSMMGGMGGFGGGMGGFGGGGMSGMGGMGGGMGGGGFGGASSMGGGMGGGSMGGLGSQMQAPAFSGFPGAMPNSPLFSGPTGNPVTNGPADQLMLQNLQWKPDWTGINDAQATLKKNAAGPLAPFPMPTNQLPAAPSSTLKPWDWLNQIYPGSGQDRAVGSGQGRPGWAPPAGTRGWAVGVGADATTPSTLLPSTGGATPTNTPFTGSLITDPGQAASTNLNQQYFQLAQQQLQEQIQQVNQSFQVQQQQLAQQASQFGMTTQLAQQQQQLQQQQFDANQQLQRQLAELQNAQLQQNLGMQSQQFNQQMGLQGAQLGLQAGQFNQQMGLQGAQLGLQQQQLGAQYGLSAAQLGQGQQQLGVQVQQLNQQYQQAQQAAYQQYLTSGNQDQLQRELANQAAKFQQAQAQIQQAQYGGTMQLQQQQLRGQTGLSLAQMASQQQQAGYDRQMQIFNSAMQNPWVQQLSGMAPQWGAAGGPQEAGQASAQGLPNMPSQGGGINLPNLNQYFPDINVPQYLQGQTPQVGGSPFQNNWQSVMSGLGQFSPYGQSPITLPDNPFPFQVPQFNSPFNFSPVQSQFNFQPTSVPLEGQMPWAANPSPTDPNTTNPTTTPPGNNYQAGPLTFTGQGSMGLPPTSGYSGGGVTYTLPNQQTFGSQDVWNWEQQNPGSSPDQAYQFEMGSHGFPGWDFPIGQGGGFPIGSTVGWNMGSTPASGFNPTMPTPPGSGQDRVGSGQDDLAESWGGYGTDPRQGEQARGGIPQNWQLLPPATPYAGIPGWLQELSLRYNVPPELLAPDLVQSGGPMMPDYTPPAWTPDHPGEGQDRRRVGSGQGAFGFGETNPFAGGANSLTSGDPTSWGMGPVQQGGGLGGWTNWGASGTTDPWNFGSPGQGTSGGLMSGDWTNTQGQSFAPSVAGGGGSGSGWSGSGWGGGDPYASWGQTNYWNPNQGQAASTLNQMNAGFFGGGDPTQPPPNNTTGGGWQNYNLYAPYNPNPQMQYSDIAQSGTNPLMQGDPTGYGMGPVQQGGGNPNPLMTGDPSNYGMGPVQMGGGGGSGPPGPPTPDPTGGGVVDAGGHPTGSNTTLDAYQQYQQALQQWQQQEQAYQQFGQQDTNWQNAWNQYYGNWRQHFGQPGYDTSALAQWRQGNPEPTAVQNPGAPPQYQALNPQDFSNWITSQGTNPYKPPAAPTLPTYENFAAMSPFQQAGLQSQAQLSGIAWPQYMNMMRQNWGSGGVTAPPVQSPLTMANLNNNTLNNLSFQNLLSVFGQTPQQYQTTYSPYWSQAQVPQVSGMMGGGY